MFEYIIKKIVYVYMKLVFWVKVEGLENIPKNEGAILAPNHISNIDGPLIISTISKRTVYTMSKKEIFKPAWSWFLTKMGCFPVDRSKKDMASLKKSINLLKQNNLLCIFPEGTRNGIAKGEKLHNGVAFLILTAKVPVIPVAIIGKVKPFSKIILRYGKPIYFDEYYNLQNKQEKFEEINKKILLNIKMQLTNTNSYEYNI